LHLSPTAERQANVHNIALENQFPQNAAQGGNLHPGPQPLKVSFSFFLSTQLSQYTSSLYFLLFFFFFFFFFLEDDFG